MDLFFFLSRQLLLQSRVREEYESPGMKQVVRVAMQLAEDGSMPGPGEHGRRSEFVKRCAAALRVLDPSKETDLKKLGAQDQALIRQALGGDERAAAHGVTGSTGCINSCAAKHGWDNVRGGQDTMCFIKTPLLPAPPACQGHPPPEPPQAPTPNA